MAENLPITDLLGLSDSRPVIDVRTPSEYARGHIPGAVNIPLFDDHERRVVGTLYKQKSKRAAIYRGLEFAGKKLPELAREGEKAAGKERVLLLHCWRGGMRSSSMAWLFETAGLSCRVLEGGYRSYRRFLREQLSMPFHLKVIGGRTGSGKTAILHQLEKMGHQVVDLEGIAHHKGSAFGALGETPQPTTEQFENDLFDRLFRLDRSRWIWIEDESRNIGKCVIPGELYDQMLEGDLLFLDIPREERAKYLVGHYAASDPDALKACVSRIEKKLGGDRTKVALDSIDRGDFFQTAMITLHYYDKAYMYSLEKNHKSCRVVPSGVVDAGANAALLQKHLSLR